MQTNRPVSSPISTPSHPPIRTLLCTVLCLVALLGAAPAGAQERVVPDSLPERPRVPIYDPGQPVLEKVLKNGVRILVQEQRTSQNVAGVVAFRMGVRYETEETAGLGNMLLQAMLGGTTKSSASDFHVRLRGTNSKLSASVGADVGQIVIETDREHAAGAATLLADIALFPSLPDTVVEAVRVRATSDATFAAESPLPSAFGQFLSTMCMGTPYQRIPQGLVTAIAQARRSDLLALHKRVSAGGNMTFVFVGNVDGKRLLAQLEKSLAAATAGPALEPSGPELTPLASDMSVTQQRPWLAHAVVIGYPAPGYLDPDFAAFAMIDSYLRSEDRSPIVYWMANREDAVSPGVVWSLFPTRGFLAVFFGATTEKLPAARDTTLAVLQRLRVEPLDKGEWTVQLKRVQDGYFFKQNEPVVRAKMLANYAAQGLPLDFPSRFETALLKLKPEDVRLAAERWFTHSCQVVLGPPPAPAGDGKP
ncbi:MAG TPA: insulinase family protein [Candidatus Eisenbacteria bacterium]|nr:insulinase family protein [Candidatus Eisenbacteria bacterium]